MTYPKSQSKLVELLKLEPSGPASQERSCCHATPSTLALVCLQTLCCFFPPLTASLKRALRIAHNAQLSFLTNTLMAQHCLLAATISWVGGKCTSGNSLALCTVSLAHSQEATTSQTVALPREVAHLGFGVSPGMSEFPSSGQASFQGQEC